MCAYRWEIYFCPNLTVRTTASVQIGIDYTDMGEEDELSGCVNDAMNIREFLISGFYVLRIVRSLTHSVLDRELGFSMGGHSSLHRRYLGFREVSYQGQYPRRYEMAGERCRSRRFALLLL